MKHIPHLMFWKQLDWSLIFLIVCVSVYISAVFCLSLRTSWFTFFVFMISVIFGLSFSYQKLKNVTIQLQNYKPISFWYFFLSSIPVSILLLCLGYPGFNCGDILEQWHSIHTGEIDDWHPAIHTLLIWLGSQPFNNIMEFVTFQILIFNVINSSLFHELSKRHYPKWMVLTGFFITLLSPTTICYISIALKDSLFAISVFALTEMLLLTHLSNGKWIKSNANTTLLGITIGLASLLRHNGILFTIPFLLTFSYLFYNKYILRLILIAIATVFIIKVPIYSYFDVKPHLQSKEELCGLPATILCEVFTKKPTALDNETIDFMLSITNYKKWKLYYKSGSLNSIKQSYKATCFSDAITQNFNATIHRFNATISKFTIPKLLKKSLKAAIKEPELALEGILNLTELVWSPFRSFSRAPYVLLRSFYNDPNKLYIFVKTSAFFYCATLRFTFITGWYIILLLLSMFFSFHRLRWKAFWIISPILIYNFGTMLVLCGPEDFRFFFFNTLITLPYMILLFSPKSDKLHNKN